MFHISDAELNKIEGIEASERSERSEPRRPTSMPIAGLGAPDDDGSDPSLGPAPLSPPVAPVALQNGSLVRGAGLALVFATTGLVGGMLIGGPWGGAAGVVGVGALRNLVRTKAMWSDPDPAKRSEAGKSATMGVFGLGVAAMLGYQAYKAKRES